MTIHDPHLDQSLAWSLETKASQAGSAGSSHSSSTRAPAVHPPERLTVQRFRLRVHQRFLVLLLFFGGQTENVNNFSGQFKGPSMVFDSNHPPREIPSAMIKLWWEFGSGCAIVLSQAKKRGRLCWIQIGCLGEYFRRSSMWWLLRTKIARFYAQST